MGDNCIFTSRSARTAGTKIALRFPCLFVCLSVCASALITCAIYYVIRYYATAVYSSVSRFAGQATIKVGLCCLDGENVVGSREDPCLYSCTLVAWPKLSFVYCTGKASGWFFRHEMSDLFVFKLFIVVFTCFHPAVALIYVRIMGGCLGNNFSSRKNNR